MSDSTQRFSNRVSDYIKYRPSYPRDVLKFLRERGSLTIASRIADVGAGTGIFTKLLLDEDYAVVAVEPNDAMREAADAELGSNPDYRSLNGTAEATKLAAQSMDLIVCAQAFHWFDPAKTRAEFSRILKPAGKVALIWNNRQVEVDAFSRAYEDLLESSASDYTRVNHQNLSAVDFEAFFKSGKYELVRFANAQVFDEVGLLGRAFSSSYVPPAETADGQLFRQKLMEIFREHESAGEVKVSYLTEVYLGEV